MVRFHNFDFYMGHDVHSVATAVMNYSTHCPRISYSLLQPGECDVMCIFPHLRYDRRSMTQFIPDTLFIFPSLYKGLFAKEGISLQSIKKGSLKHALRKKLHPRIIWHAICRRDSLTLARLCTTYNKQNTTTLPLLAC